MISTETVQNIVTTQASKRWWTNAFIHALTTEEQPFAEACGPKEADKGSLGIVGAIAVPYNLIKNADTKFERLICSNCAQFAIDFCHACRINGVTSFLTLPDDEHVHDPANANLMLGRKNLNMSALPTCDNLYYTGVGAALRLLNRILPNRSTGEATEFLQQLDALLEVRPDLNFKADQNILTFKNNVSVVVDIFAKDPDKVFLPCPPITPEDHVLASSRLPVDYNPLAPEMDDVTKLLEGWSSPKGSPHYILNIEANFANMLLPPTIDFKGITINIGPGGAGMSSMQDLRDALFGEAATRIAPGKGNDLDTEFGRGFLVGKRAYFIDDASETHMSASTVAQLKTLATGKKISGRAPYAKTDSQAYGQAIIINSNCMPTFTQREAAGNHLARRLHVVHHDNLFDDASIIDPSQRAARPDLLNAVINGEEHSQACLSDMLNRTMKAAAGMIVRHGYTPVEREIAYMRDALGEQDTVSKFLESIGGIFGQEWPTSPQLFDFGHGEKMALWAAFGDSENVVLGPGIHEATFDASSSIIPDAKTGTNDFQASTTSIGHEYECHMINETAILHKLYEQYCEGAGLKNSSLGRKNFKLELLKRGYEEIKIRGPFGRQALVIVTAGTPATVKGLARFVAEQLAARKRFVADHEDEPTYAEVSRELRDEMLDEARERREDEEATLRHDQRLWNVNNPYEDVDRCPLLYPEPDPDAPDFPIWLWYSEFDEDMVERDAEKMAEEHAAVSGEVLDQITELLHTSGVDPSEILSALQSLHDTDTTTDTTTDTKEA